MFLKQIYDQSLAQYAYLIGCQRTGQAIIVDPERDIDRYREIAAENDLEITAVAETHIHADFVSGARELMETDERMQVYLSDEGDADWKSEWAQGCERVTFLKHGDQFKIGNIQFTVLHTPGHTPEHVSYLVEDQGGGADEPMALLSGDFMFVGDVGRPDLLESAAGNVGSREPSARRLYQSILEFSKLPEFLQVLPAHGAGSACGKALGAIPSSTVGYEMRFNPALKIACKEGEDAFVDYILSGQPEPPMYFARMKQVNKEGIDVLRDLPKPKEMSTVSIAGVSGQNGSVVLDMRADRRAFMAKHLRGSLHTPPAKFSVAVGSYVKPEQDIYLLLEKESQLDGAVRELIRMGFDHIRGYALAAEVLADINCSACLAATPVIKITEAEEARDKHEGATILDVRSAGEYKEAHMEGTINVAYTRIAGNMDKLPDPAQGPLVVHCGSGVRASLAVPYLERLGYQIIFADGMFSDWKQTCGDSCGV